MKFKKILKLELFLGFFIIFLIMIITLNLLISTIFKNIFDLEINKRLEIIGRNIAEKIDKNSFLLSSEFRDIQSYKNIQNLIMNFKNIYGMDIYLINDKGKVCIGTTDDYQLIDKFFIEEIQNYSITFFENNLPIKLFVYPYLMDQKIYGYILMEIKGDFLNSFIKIKNLQNIIILIIFVIAIIISYIFSFIFSKRIENTVNSMNKIASGDLSHRIKIDWIDEFSFLQYNINKMVDKINELQNLRYQEMQLVAMGLAHEIKNPLTAMLNKIELLQKKLNNKGDLNIEFEIIKSEIFRLNDIINSFIYFAKGDIIPKDQIKIKEIVYSLKNYYNDLKIKFNNIDPDFFLNIDNILFERALKNIVRNSLEANAKEIFIEIKKLDQNIIFIISDDAKVIPNDIREKIFLPFFTTKNTGMGIGLSITKNIIERFNGKIEYTVINNRNAFIIELPIK